MKSFRKTNLRYKTGIIYEIIIPAFPIISGFTNVNWNITN